MVGSNAGFGSLFGGRCGYTVLRRMIMLDTRDKGLFCFSYEYNCLTFLPVPCL